MCHDRLQQDEIALTHEFLSLMLGTRRAGVTTAMHILEGMGMVRSKRGVVVVLSREKLIETAGGSYGVAEAEYTRLIGVRLGPDTVRRPAPQGNPQGLSAADPGIIRAKIVLARMIGRLIRPRNEATSPLTQAGLSRSSSL